MIRLLPFVVAALMLPQTQRGAGSQSDTPAGEAARETVRVGGIVLKWIRGDRDANFRRVEPLIREAAKQGAQVVCTTECCLDGYAIADKSIPLATYRALGEPIPGGAYFRRFAKLADELDIHLIAGMAEADGEARYNTAVVLGPNGRLVGKYRKQTLGHELVRNTPGSESPVFNLPFGKVGVIICADRTDPGLVRRLCAQGADLLIVPSGGMFGPEKNDPIVQARSRENRIPIVFVHPAEFLVTAPDGSITTRTLLGNRLLISPDQEGSEHDQKGVFRVDLPIGVASDLHPQAGTRDRPVLDARLVHVARNRQGVEPLPYSQPAGPVLRFRQDAVDP